MEVPCDVYSPCKQVATESVTPSEVSVSRLAESESVVYSPEASQSVVGTDSDGNIPVSASGWCSSHS